MLNSDVLAAISGIPSTAGDILVLDSNEYIYGFTDPDSLSAMLLLAIIDYRVVVPAMVVDEVTSNLAAYSPRLPGMFYALLSDPAAHMVRVYQQPPIPLWQKYQGLGLAPEDGVIAALAEWVGARYLVSENRHFLRHLEMAPFVVMGAEACLGLIRGGQIRSAEAV